MVGVVSNTSECDCSFITPIICVRSISLTYCVSTCILYIRSAQYDNGCDLHVDSDLSRGMTVYSMIVNVFEATIPSACREIGINILFLFA